MKNINKQPVASRKTIHYPYIFNLQIILNFEFYFNRSVRSQRTPLETPGGESLVRHSSFKKSHHLLLNVF